MRWVDGLMDGWVGGRGGLARGTDRNGTASLFCLGFCASSFLRACMYVCVCVLSVCRDILSIRLDEGWMVGL